MTDATGPGTGHNAFKLPNKEEIAATLGDQYPTLTARAAEIVAKLAKVPPTISTQDESDKVSEFVRACMTFEKNANAAREEEKAPWLAAERAVDGFFNALRTNVDNVKKDLSRRATAWDIKVMAAEKAERKRIAKAAQEAADVAAMQAKTNKQKAEAQADQQIAQDAAAAVAVRPAELSRSRTVSGVTRSLRVKWKHEVTESKKVPKRFLAPSAELIEGAIKAATTEDGQCLLEIPGVRIYPDYSSQVR